MCTSFFVQVRALCVQGRSDRGLYYDLPEKSPPPHEFLLSFCGLFGGHTAGLYQTVKKNKDSFSLFNFIRSKFVYFIQSLKIWKMFSRQAENIIDFLRSRPDLSQVLGDSRIGFGRCLLSCLLHYIHSLSIPLHTNRRHLPNPLLL